MAPRRQATKAGPLPMLLFVLLVAAGGGLFIAQTGPGLSLGLSLLLVVVFVGFLNTELALHIILLSMLLSPEIVIGGIGDISIGKPAIKGDMVVLRVEDLVLTAATLAWIAKAAIFKEIGLLRRTPLNLPIFTFIATLTIATLFGVLLGNVLPIRGFFYVLKYIEYFVVFFMTVNHIREERQLWRLLTTAFVTCAIASIIGILQIPSGERVAAPFEGQFGEPNTFGGYLVLMLAIILGFALTAKSLPAQVGWYVFAGLAVLPLLYTLSRSSWLASIPMCLALIFLSRRRLVLMIGLGLVIIIGSAIYPAQVIERYNYTFYAKQDRGEYGIAGVRFDTSTSARIESWRYGVTGWAKRPFLGYGVTGFAFIDAQYVRVLVEAGLIGLAAFLWLLWRTLWTAWDTYRQVAGGRFEGLAVGYIAGLIAMMAHSFGANTFIIVRIMEPFWFMTAIIVLLPQLREPRTAGIETNLGSGA
jgi:O-antigen ligase